MEIAAIIELIRGVLQFPEKVLELIRVLKKTPTEKHDDIMKRISEEKDSFEGGGRPKWD